MIEQLTPSEINDPWARARFVLRLHRQNAEPTSLVKIQPGGNKPPLFLVHGVGGGMFWGYANLARALGPEQPVYAFKSRGLAGLEEFKSIEEMASHYVADLRRFQPQGPYYLGGYCFGGAVAYEMARQLRAQGEGIALLLVLNCWPNNSSYTRVNWTAAWMAKFFWNLLVRLRFQAKYGLKQPWAYFKWRTAWLLRKSAALCWRAAQGQVVAEETIHDSRQSPPERSLWRTHVRAWLRFQPQPYDGKIVLLRTRGHPLVCSFDHQMGWGDFAKGGVTVRLCRGDHESILEEQNVTVAARHLKEVLDEIQQQAGSNRISAEDIPQQSSPSPARAETTPPLLILEPVQPL